MIIIILICNGLKLLFAEDAKIQQDNKRLMAIIEKMRCLIIGSYNDQSYINTLLCRNEELSYKFQIEKVLVTIHELICDSIHT